MNVGELFVNLGIKGSEKTLGALSATQKGLQSAGSTALETKAAILGAVYAFGRMIEASGVAGTGLTNFNAVTGVSTDTLQRYQYAARQMGVANEDVAGSFKSLQSAMTKTLMGEGAPKGLGRVALLTGGLTSADIDRFARDPEALMKRLQQYALTEKNAGLRNEVLKSFGMSDQMIAGMARGAFRPSAMAKAPTYSTNELRALDQANIAWSNLGTKVEMAFGHFNAAHGGQLVRDISKITDQVIKLTEAFIKLAEKLKFFELIGKVFEGWTLIFQEINKAAAVKTPTTDNSSLMDKLIGERFAGDVTKLFAPKLAPTGTGKPSGNIEVNQTLNFQHDGKDSKKTGDSTKKAIQDAFRQYTAQGQGS
jgi:hypothetical protein